MAVIRRCSCTRRGHQATSRPVRCLLLAMLACALLVAGGISVFYYICWTYPVGTSQYTLIISGGRAWFEITYRTDVRSAINSPQYSEPSFYFGRVVQPAVVLVPKLELATTHFALGLPMWVPLLIASYFAIQAERQYRRQEAKRGCCIRCGYDLTGNVSGRCPECGNAVDDPAIQCRT
jgi:hypothetical protein